MELRRQKTVERIPNPSRLDRANSLGYKAKTGFVVVQVKVSRGRLRKIRPSLGRRQKRTGISKIKRAKSIKTIAEEIVLYFSRKNITITRSIVLLERYQ